MPREMKKSGVSWLDEIPVNWETARLKGTFSFGKGLPITKDNLVEQGIPVISYGQIHSKTNSGVRVQDDLIRYVDPAYIETNPESLVHIGDFIFADTSEDREGCGNCVYVDKEMQLFAGYHTVVLKANDKIDSRFLAYQFKTDPWRTQIRAEVSGVKVFSISRKILSNTTMLIAPDEEQKLIADFLDHKCAEIDRVMAATEKTIAEYKALKQSIITEAVTKGVRGKRPMKDSGIAWIGEIPKDWSVALLKYSIRWKSEKGAPDEEVLSLYRDYGVIPKDSRDDNHNVTSLDTSGYKVVDVGDFVINKMKAWQGSMAISDYRGIVSPAYHVCTITTPHINKKYFHYLMRNPLYIPEYLRLSTGMRIGQWDLGFDDFKNLPFILPSEEEQQEIVDFIEEKSEAIDQLIGNKQQLLEELTTYKKSIIYEYVTGKKEVPACQ